MIAFEESFTFRTTAEELKLLVAQTVYSHPGNNQPAQMVTGYAEPGDSQQFMLVVVAMEVALETLFTSVPPQYWETVWLGTFMRGLMQLDKAGGQPN